MPPKRSKFAAAAVAEIIAGPPAMKDYQRLRAAVGWRELSTPQAERGLAGSLYSITARVAGKTVGMGRVVGDGAVYYYLQDVAVHPAWQGRGIGAQLVRHLLEWFDSAAPHGASLGLMAAEGVAGFYEHLGFRRRPESRPGMFWPRDSERAPARDG